MDRLAVQNQPAATHIPDDPPGLVVVVDDNKDHRDVFCALLRKYNFTPVAAAGGHEAAEILGQIHVDLVITDLNMPGIGGLELMSKLRRASDQHDLPIIAISADGRYKDLPLESFGATAFFSKAQFDEVITAAQNILAEKREEPLLPQVQHRFGLS